MDISDYRYRIISRGRDGSYVGSFRVDVIDSWTSNIVHQSTARTQNTAQLAAETKAAELNAPLVALTFAASLAQHLEDARNADVSPGNVLEDADRLLEWHMGALRGLISTPIDQDRLYYNPEAAAAELAQADGGGFWPTGPVTPFPATER